MRKFLFLRRFIAPTAPTAPTFGRNTVGTLLSQCRNTVGTHYGTLHSLLSRLKTSFNSLFGRNSRNRNPNLSQELEKEDYGRILVDDREPIYHDPYSSDEFDHEDYDEWYEDNYEEWWDGPVFNTRGSNFGWEQRAVDEAIEEEKYDSTSGDIPF